MLFLFGIGNTLFIILNRNRTDGFDLDNKDDINRDFYRNYDQYAKNLEQLERRYEYEDEYDDTYDSNTNANDEGQSEYVIK